MAKNKKSSAVSKFEIALHALKDETTLNEICKRYKVSPSQVLLGKINCLIRARKYLAKVRKQLYREQIMSEYNALYIKKLVN